MEFTEFPKIPRLRRDCIITEKIDGTNAAVIIAWNVPPDNELVLANVLHDGHGVSVLAQSRKRFITPSSDNFGFAKWVAENADGLVRILGPGVHFGEWWGQGIQRGYGLDHKRFSLFNTARYDGAIEASPSADRIGLDTVPVLYEGIFGENFAVDRALQRLEWEGSHAAPGFMKPEGIVIYHTAARQSFKVTLENDEAPKGKS